MRHGDRDRLWRRRTSPDDVPDAALLAAAVRRRRRGGGSPGRLLLVLALVLVALVVVAASLGAGFVAAGGANDVLASQCTLRGIRPITLGANTFVYSATGSRLGAIASNLHREPLGLDQVSPWLPKATIAIEDRRFYHHGGLDYVGIARAAVTDLAAGHVVEGGSTLEQELARNLYLGTDKRTFSWKLKQACLAIRIARRWSKRQILDTYLNQVAYGAHAYGAAAAAYTYFGRPARRLTLSQAALLAGLPQAPSEYNPFLDPKAALARRNQVLRAMLAAGQITRARFKLAVAHPLGLHPGSLYVAVHHPEFVTFVEKQLVSQFGAGAARGGGLAVKTTLRPRLQSAALRSERAILRHRGDPAAALVAINPRTGGIEAMSSFQPGHPRRVFNLAAQGQRQAGSAFKPFTLADAIWNGFTLNSKFRGPPEIVIRSPVCANGSQPWVVHNYGGESFGTIPLSTAIAQSVNTVFAQVVARVLPANVASVAAYAGITSPLNPVCSITLGTSPVTPLEMTDAYATFADGGYHHPPQAILSVRAPDGRVLERLSTAASQAMPPNVASTVTRALAGVVRHGTGTAAALPGVTAVGKTGTTENEQDAWFCGYVGRRLATCVWVGFPNGEIPMHDIEGVPDVVGGTLPAEIWRDFMTSALGLR
jgi:penicillin-binding protein 1A